MKTVYLLSLSLWFSAKLLVDALYRLNYRLLFPLLFETDVHLTLVVCIMYFCNCCLTDVTADLTVCSAGIPGSLSLHLQNELALIQFSPFSFDCTVWFSKSDPTGPEALTSDSAWDGLLMPHRHAVSSAWLFTGAPVRHYWQPRLRYEAQLVSFIQSNLQM